MQLRSRNNVLTPASATARITATPKTQVLQMDKKTIELCYESFLTIKYDLLIKLDDFNKEKHHIEKIKKSIIIYKMIDSKIVELKFLKDQPGFSTLKHFYDIIHKKINKMMKDVSNIITEESHIEDENIELIAEFFRFMMKIRNKF
jgi:hypothetical protein